MCDNDTDTRFEAALRLAEIDPALGAQTLSSIAANEEFDPDTCSEALHNLAGTGPEPPETLRGHAFLVPQPPRPPRPPRPPGRPAPH